MANNLDSVGDFVSRIVWTAPKSDIYFVKAFGRFASGYTLTVTEGEAADSSTAAPTPTPVIVLRDDFNDARVIGLGEAVSTSIFEDGFLKVELNEGTTYTIKVSSDTLKVSMLTFFDNRAEVLERNTDFDGAGDKIIWDAKRTGSYFVGVGGRGTGTSYTLTVTETGTAFAQTPAQTSTPGAPTTTAPSSGTALTFASVSAGGNHTCGVTTNGAAYCWGYNKYGSLGNGQTDNQTATGVGWSVVRPLPSRPAPDTLAPM